MMDDILTKLKTSYPKLNFKLSDSFYWSPSTNEVFYSDKSVDKVGKWSLLHETGHAILGHQNYDSDFMLIRLEIEAWQKANELAKTIGISIDEDHIEDCLDTYRDWLYKRSICPKCSNKSFQQSDKNYYRCFNCHALWRVTNSKFCRTYRMADNSVLSQQVFV